MPSGGLGNFFFHSKKENSSEKVYRMQWDILYYLYFTLCINSQIQRVNMLIWIIDKNILHVYCGIIYI